MALSADPSYIVIPVQDPFLYQWFMWQMWLPYHCTVAFPALAVDPVVGRQYSLIRLSNLHDMAPGQELVRRSAWQNI